MQGRTESATVSVPAGAADSKRRLRLEIAAGLAVTAVVAALVAVLIVVLVPRA